MLHINLEDVLFICIKFAVFWQNHRYRFLCC